MDEERKGSGRGLDECCYEGYTGCNKREEQLVAGRQAGRQVGGGVTLFCSHICHYESWHLVLSNAEELEHSGLRSRDGHENSLALELLGDLGEKGEGGSVGAGFLVCEEEGVLLDGRPEDLLGCLLR